MLCKFFWVQFSVVFGVTPKSQRFILMCIWVILVGLDVFGTKESVVYTHLSSALRQTDFVSPTFVSSSKDGVPASVPAGKLAIG